MRVYRAARACLYTSHPLTLPDIAPSTRLRSNSGPITQRQFVTVNTSHRPATTCARRPLAAPARGAHVPRRVTLCQPARRVPNARSRAASASIPAWGRARPRGPDEDRTGSAGFCTPAFRRRIAAAAWCAAAPAAAPERVPRLAF